MSVMDQIKLANAGRRMYQKMCNQCRVKLTREFASSYKQQQLTGQYNQNPQEVKQRTLEILCTNCKTVYLEAMENR